MILLHLASIHSDKHIKNLKILNKIEEKRRKFRWKLKAIYKNHEWMNIVFKIRDYYKKNKKIELDKKNQSCFYII